jgi:hypothetical protein
VWLGGKTRTARRSGICSWPTTSGTRQTKTSRPKVLHSFGREDQLDRDAVKRPVASLSRLLDPSGSAGRDRADRAGVHFLPSVWSRCAVVPPIGDDDEFGHGPEWSMDHLCPEEPSSRAVAVTTTALTFLRAASPHTRPTDTSCGRPGSDSDVRVQRLSTSCRWVAATLAQWGRTWAAGTAADRFQLGAWVLSGVSTRSTSRDSGSDRPGRGRSRWSPAHGASDRHRAARHQGLQPLGEPLTPASCRSFRRRSGSPPCSGSRTPISNGSRIWPRWSARRTTRRSPPPRACGRAPVGDARHVIRLAEDIGGGPRAREPCSRQYCAARTRRRGGRDRDRATRPSW